MFCTHGGGMHGIELLWWINIRINNVIFYISYAGNGYFVSAIYFLMFICDQYSFFVDVTIEHIETINSINKKGLPHVAWWCNRIQ